MNSAPKEAIACANCAIKLQDRVRNELPRDAIIQATSTFSNLNGFPEARSLQQFDTTLSEIAQLFHTYLQDMYKHLNQIALQLAAKKEDSTTIAQLMTDIDSVQERLVTIPFDIAKFYQEHADKLDPLPRVNEPECVLAQQILLRKLVMDGHKSWLMHQAQFIGGACYSIPRLYGLATGLTMQ